MEFEILDLPGDSWRVATGLPMIHRDPVDRLLIAPELSDRMTRFTIDANIRPYPVSCV